jgi:hypothetical protein
MKLLIFTISIGAHICAFCNDEGQFSRKTPQISKNSLLKYAHVTYSQWGEDGVIKEILSRIGLNNGFFVEFGAADGVYLSNTKLLWDNGWSGCFIESNEMKYLQLINTYRNSERIICLNQFVTYDPSCSRGGGTIDQIRDTYFPNQNVDVLSIDVDSYDYLILENLIMKPKLICIEGPICWNPLFEDRIPYEFAIQTYIGQPPAVIKSIGEKKGYTLICISGTNYFFIRNDLTHYFLDTPKDLLTLWEDYWYYMGIRFPKDQQWIEAYRRSNPIFQQFEKGKFIRFPITPPIFY